MAPIFTVTGALPRRDFGQYYLITRRHSRPADVTQNFAPDSAIIINAVRISSALAADYAYCMKPIHYQPAKKILLLPAPPQLAFR